MPISLPIAMLIGTAASAGAQTVSTIHGNRQQSRAFQSEQEAERYRLDQELALERERATEEKRRYDAEQKRLQDEAARRQPYDNMRLAALAALAKRYGVDVGAMMGPGGGGFPQGGGQRTNTPITSMPMAPDGSDPYAAQGTLAGLTGAGGGSSPLGARITPSRVTMPTMGRGQASTGGQAPANLLQMAQMARAWEQPRTVEPNGYWT